MLDLERVGVVYVQGRIDGVIGREVTNAARQDVHVHMGYTTGRSSQSGHPQRNNDK